MKILAAVDGSDAAYHALRSACRIAEKTASSVVAFYVNKGPEYTPEETGWISLTEKIASELETLGHEAIQKAYSIGREYGIPLEGIMSSGIPSDEILDYAEAHGIIKLIVMGHSLPGWGTQEFVESAARTVIARSRVPVLVTSSEIDIRRMLIAVDSSEASRRVAEFGGRLARTLGAELGVVAFVPDAEAMIGEYRLIAEVPNIEKHLAASDKDQKELLERAVEAAKKVLDPMDVRVSAIIKVGHADELLSEAPRYDSLVLGHRTDPHHPARINRFAGKLLDTLSISVFFVQ